MARKSQFHLPNPTTGLQELHHFETEVAQVLGLSEHYRQPNTEYTVGDIVFCVDLPTGLCLESTTEGTTDLGDITLPATIEPNTTTITDGEVEWLVRNLVNIKDAISVMIAATASAAGASGLVPAPAAGKQAQYLRGDATWATPTNTTYSNFVKSGSGAKAGLVPAPSTTAGTTKYLREDGTWTKPPNTTYSVVTSSADGLMSSAMLTRLGSGGGITAASLAANGYVKFGDGFILQWGFAAANAASVTFPVAFSSACYSISGTTYGSYGLGYDTIKSYSKTSFTLYIHDSDIRLFWMATGK